jgi:uncharacterized membrane protein (UPF0127 family)
VLGNTSLAGVLVGLLVMTPLAVSSATLDTVSSGADPVTLSSCSLDNGSVNVAMGNRTRHDLLSMVLHLVDLDRDGKPIGGLEVAYAPAPSLGGGQSTTYSVPASDIPLYGGTATEVAHQTCAIESAMLSGNHPWAQGQPWSEPLVDTVPTTASASAPTTAVAPVAPPAPVQSPFTVLAAWTTPGQNVTFLHVRVNLHPSFSTSTQSSDFRVVTSSQSGGDETEYGMNQSAPTYMKVDRVSNFLAALNKQTLATPVPVAAVDASEDLGRQGRVQVNAGDPMTEVVTFTVRPDTNVDQGAITKAFNWLATPSGDDPAQQPDSGPADQQPNATVGAAPPPTGYPKFRITLPSGGFIQLDVFNTDVARSIGLSGRSQLPYRAGGLFPIAMVDRPIMMSMMNTPFALDFIFVRCDTTISSIVSAAGAKPLMSGAQIPQAQGYGCWVVAIPAGESLNDGVRVGMHIPNLPRYAP